MLSLPFPVFVGLYGLIHTARLDSAIDCMYIPYAAAKYGKKCADALFKECGGVFVEADGDTLPAAYTEDDMLAAQARMDAIIKKKKERGTNGL